MNLQKRERKEETKEWAERIVQIRRVTKVVKGGKKISFRAVVVIGNEKGLVGVGIGKAGDVIGAVKKAVADGRKHMVEIPLTKNLTIPHLIIGRSGAARVVIRPSASGSGVIAGSSIRMVLEIGGVQNILTKRLGSSNPLNNARATLDALSKLKRSSETVEA